MEPNDTIGDLRPERLDSRRPLRHRAQGAGALGHAVDDVIESVGRVSRQTSGFLTRQSEQRPKLMLACAAGLGFALGGGLALSTGALLARVGGRLVLAHFVQSWTRSRGADEVASKQPPLSRL